MNKNNIKELNQINIERANSNSFYNRGANTEKLYKKYAEEIKSWSISDKKKEQLLDRLYTFFEKILSLEAQHVSWTVAGPANYNAKRLDKTDKIMAISSEFSNWFGDLKKEIKQKSKIVKKTTFEEFVINLNKQPLFADYLLMDFIKEKDEQMFIKAFEYVQEQGVKKYRKNSNLYKIYSKLKNGEKVWNEKEIIFTNEDYEAFIEDDRVFIKFKMKPKKQLMVALKSRGYWWNAHKSAWSTYIKKLDKEWICSLSKNYEKYI